MLTTNFNINLTRPVSEGTIRAEAASSTTTRANAPPRRAYDDEGNQLARGSGTFVESNTALTPDIGYE